MTQPEIPRYTRWGDVPDELYTRTQLSKLDPPRKATQDTPIRGRVLYAGNKYAYLYDINETVEWEKKPRTPAQQAATAKATAAQYVCRRCGGGDNDGWGEPVRLGKGRQCSQCWSVLQAWNNHVDRSKYARSVLDRGLQCGAVIIGADDTDSPQRIVVLGHDPDQVEHGADGQVLADITLDATSPREAFDAITDAVSRWSHQELGQERPTFGIVSWPNVLGMLVRLYRPNAGCWDSTTREAFGRSIQAYKEAKELPWMATFTGQLGDPIRYGRWHHMDDSWPSYYAEVRQECDAYQGPSLSLRWENRTMPGATGDVLADTRAVLPLLRRIANGTEPTADRTPWALHPPLDTWDGQ